MSDAFSIKEALSFGWKTFKAHPWLFVQVGIVYFLIQIVLTFFQGMLPDFIAPVVGIALGTFLGIGIIHFYLNAHDAPGSASVKMLWHPEPFWRYLVTSIVMGVLVMLGLFLLIVPGIILALAWSFTLYLVIERKLWTLDALLESARITRGSRIKLFILGLAIAGINIVGMLLLFVGLLVSVPISLLASIHAYRTLAAKAPAVVVEAPVAPAPVV